MTTRSIMTETPTAGRRKWRTLLLLAFAELLAMGVWFSASAVVPALTQAWNLDNSGRSWLTMSVQIGFVVGAFGSAVFNLADRIPARWLFTASAFLAGLATLAIPFGAVGLQGALLLRFLTGLFLAGVYPVGMKIMATWTRADRGFAIGLLVGALTVGSAGPHLLNIFAGPEDWQRVLYMAASLAGLGGLLAAFFVREGPYRTASPRFNFRYIGEIFRDRDIVLANLGYLGHMWELYAMWAWMPIFLRLSFEAVGASQTWANVSAFSMIAVGGIGSLLAGLLADRFGRTTITMLSLFISGACALLVGPFFAASPAALSAIALIWGFAIVADSAQYSTAISELADPRYIGTALTLQTSLGFLLTMISIRLVPVVQQQLGWEGTFAFLALGPVVGLWAMGALKRSPAAARLAGGRG